MHPQSTAAVAFDSPRIRLNLPELDASPPKWAARGRSGDCDGRVQVIQYRDGIELVLQPSRSVRALELSALTAVVGLATLAVLAGFWWALGVAGAGLGGLAWLVSQPVQTRRLLAHGASETFLLQGGRPGGVLAGGARDDLFMALESIDGQRHRLRIFSASGEHGLGAAGLLGDDDLAAVRRFVALAGVRMVGAARAA